MSLSKYTRTVDFIFLNALLPFSRIKSFLNDDLFFYFDKYD